MYPHLDPRWRSHRYSHLIHSILHVILSRIGHSSREKLGLDFPSLGLLPECIAPSSQVHSGYKAISFLLFQCRELCVEKFVRRAMRLSKLEGLRVKKVLAWMPLPPLTVAVGHRQICLNLSLASCAKGLIFHSGSRLVYWSAPCIISSFDLEAFPTLLAHRAVYLQGLSGQPRCLFY
jgi:hypothetical protein